jgi:D-alanyl-D-alanine carboxypeptidase
MACRNTAFIAAISVLAVVHVPGIEATERTGTAVTDAAMAMTVSATTPPPSDTRGVGSGTTVSDTAAQLRILVDETVRESASIPGLVLHIEAPGQDVAVSVAAGVADRATGMPLTPDAGFRIAGNTKTFTAAAALRLVEQGTVALDTPIADLLAPDTVDALRADGYRPDAITVRQLLLHTSGTYDYASHPAYQAAVTADPAKRWTRLEQVRFAIEVGTPVGEPGTVYAHSNTGYILLGEIIERATGTPLADAYRTLLDFEGLHLDVTYLESLEPAPPGSAARAHQYLGTLDTSGADPSFNLYGDGGLVSTVDDLATFYRALLRGDVYTEPETLDTMLEIPASNTEAQAAMGIFRIDVAGHTCWTHSGYWGTYVLTCPQIDVTIAASWGQAAPDADFDADTVLQRAFELATEP